MSLLDSADRILIAIRHAERADPVVPLLIFSVCCGETGIRTPGALQHNGFQDRRNRPLCHLSKTSFSRSASLLKQCKGTNHF